MQPSGSRQPSLAPEGSKGGYTGSFGGTANLGPPSSSRPERQAGNRRSYTISRATLSVRRGFGGWSAPGSEQHAGAALALSFWGRWT